MARADENVEVYPGITRGQFRRLPNDKKRELTRSGKVLPAGGTPLKDPGNGDSWLQRRSDDIFGNRVANAAASGITAVDKFAGKAPVIGDKDGLFFGASERVNNGTGSGLDAFLGGAAWAIPGGKLAQGGGRLGNRALQRVGLGGAANALTRTGLAGRVGLQGAAGRLPVVGGLLGKGLGKKMLIGAGAAGLIGEGLLNAPGPVDPATGKPKPVGIAALAEGGNGAPGKGGNEQGGGDGAAQLEAYRQQQQEMARQMAAEETRAGEAVRKEYEEQIAQERTQGRMAANDVRGYARQAGEIIDAQNEKAGAFGRAQQKRATVDAQRINALPGGGDAAGRRESAWGAQALAGDTKDSNALLSALGAGARGSGEFYANNARAEFAANVADLRGKQGEAIADAQKAVRDAFKEQAEGNLAERRFQYQQQQDAVNNGFRAQQTELDQLVAGQRMANEAAKIEGQQRADVMKELNNYDVFTDSAENEGLEYDPEVAMRLMSPQARQALLYQENAKKGVSPAEVDKYVADMKKKQAAKAAKQGQGQYRLAGG